MATLTEVYNLRDNSHLLNRVAAAIAKAANAIVNESDATANHTERAAWGRGVLTSPAGPIDEAAKTVWIVLQNTTIQDQYTSDPVSGGTVTDGDIEFVVNGLIDFVAGVD